MSSALTLFAVMMAIFVPIGLFVFMIQYFNYKRSTNDQIVKMQKKMEANSTQDLEKEVAALKERIIVLESIVTDRGYEIERKISNL